jgi:hypothetical protein
LITKSLASKCLTLASILWIPKSVCKQKRLWFGLCWDMWIWVMVFLCGDFSWKLVTFLCVSLLGRGFSHLYIKWLNWSFFVLSSLYLQKLNTHWVQLN